MADGSPATGLWVSVLAPAALEALLEGAEGRVDWLGIDVQHGQLTLGDLPDLVRVADLAGVPVLVRVADHAPAPIGWVLDLGAYGVVVPTVESAEQADAIGSAARHAPLGGRSTGFTRRSRLPAGHALAGLPSPLVLPMVETVAGHGAAADIAACPGVDGVFVGPVDLARSMDVAAGSAAVAEAVGDVVSAARPHGVVGMFTAGWPAPVPEGLTLVATATDVSVLQAGLGPR